MRPTRIQGGEVASNSGALAASHVIAGRLYVYDIVVYNSSGSTQYIQVFDAASLPADTAVPLMVVQVPTKATGSFAWSGGRRFTTGLVVCNSSTDTTKTIGSADCFFDVTYTPNNFA